MTAETKSPQGRGALGVALGLAAVALAALAQAGYRAHQVSQFTGAPAVIVAIETREAPRPRNDERVPVAEITLSDGERVRAPLELSSNSPFCCEVGEVIEVRYDPSDLRGTVMANRFSDLYGAQLAVPLVCGLLFLLYAKVWRARASTRAPRS